MSERVSYKETAYEYIKAQIVSCAFKPGDIIDEKGIAAQIGVSRTPVREALGKLSEEGLIDIMPRRGMVVSYLSVNDIYDIYDMRRLLEPHIVRRAVARVDREKLLEYKRRFLENRQGEALAAGDLDKEFHMYLSRCTGNRYLMKMEELLMSQSQRIRILSSMNTKERDKDARNEHVRMIDRLLEGDVEEAAQVASDHLKASMEGYAGIFSNRSFFAVDGRDGWN